MDLKLEAIVLPVTDVDRAKAFYEQAGFNLDVDHQASDEFRVVQFTPPGSACSIVFGKGLSSVTPGSAQGLHLVVNDVEATRAGLVERGVEVSEPYHFGPNGQEPGVDPQHANYATYASFTDPDGNGWLLQERRD
jgi:predicted enzyme related to lactoylglutathione lyase